MRELGIGWEEEFDLRIIDATLAIVTKPNIYCYRIMYFIQTGGSIIYETSLLQISILKKHSVLEHTMVHSIMDWLCQNQLGK